MKLPVLWKFFGLAYLISWSIFVVLYFVAGLKTGASFSYLVFFFMWGPAIAAIVCGLKFRSDWLGGISLRPRFNSFIILSFFAPLFLLTLTYYLSKGFGLEVKPYHLAVMDEENVIGTGGYYFLFGFMYLFVGLFNGLFSISEELGFRGFALSEALPEFGFWRTSLIIGVMWGFWHAPLVMTGYNYPGEPIAGVFMIVLVTLSITPLINYLTLKSRSVWAACFFHGAFNFVAGISVLMAGAGVFPYMGMIGIVGVFIGCAISLLLFVFRKKEISGLTHQALLASNDFR